VGATARWATAQGHVAWVLEQAPIGLAQGVTGRAVIFVAVALAGLVLAVLLTKALG
jgi:hypothetical protein